MAVVLIMAAALWGMGVVMKVPVRVRAIMLGLLWLAVVLMQLTLPEGHELRVGTGGSAVPWLLLGGLVGVVLAYASGLRWLRNRAPQTQEEPVQGAFTDTELNRYARHIVLREIGGKGQKRLKNARILVVGAGGLGSPALLYLAAAGVGTIGVIDDDVVDNSNLQRQVIHPDSAIGMPKVFSAQKAMEAQNPYVTVRPYHRRLTEELARDLMAEYDVVLDGTDNFDTRYLVNMAAVSAGIPLISGALSQWEGQISVFDPANGGPCYQCIFPKAPAAGLAPSCAEAGVIGPLPGVIGAMMALETIKLLTGAGSPLRAQMLIYDALWGETRKFSLKKNPDCPVCATRA